MKKPSMPLIDLLTTNLGEPSVVVCPACGNDFLPGETRIAVQCPVCQGTNQLAERACQEMDKYIKWLQTSVPYTQEALQDLEKKINVLADGHYRSELARAWRGLKIVVQDK